METKIELIENQIESIIESQNRISINQFFLIGQFRIVRSAFFDRLHQSRNQSGFFKKSFGNSIGNEEKTRQKLACVFSFTCFSFTYCRVSFIYRFNQHDLRSQKSEIYWLEFVCNAFKKADQTILNW